MGEGDAELGISDQNCPHRRPFDLRFSRFRSKPCHLPRKVDLYGVGPLFQALGEKLGHSAEGRQNDIDIVRRPDFPVWAGGTNRYGSSLDVGGDGLGLPKLSGKGQSGLEVLQLQCAPAGRVVGNKEHDTEELVKEGDTVVKDQEAWDGVSPSKRIIARVWLVLNVKVEKLTFQTATQGSSSQTTSYTLTDRLNSPFGIKDHRKFVLHDFAAQQKPHREVVDPIAFIGDNDSLLLDLFQRQGPCGHRRDDDIQHGQGDAFGRTFDQSLSLFLKTNILKGVSPFHRETWNREGLARGGREGNGACDPWASQFTTDNHPRGKVSPSQGGLYLGQDIDRDSLHSRRDFKGEAADLQLRSCKSLFVRP